MAYAAILWRYWWSWWTAVAGFVTMVLGGSLIAFAQWPVWVLGVSIIVSVLVAQYRMWRDLRDDLRLAGENTVRVKEELADAKSDLAEARSEVQDSRSEAEHLRVELGVSRAETARVQDELERLTTREVAFSCLTMVPSGSDVATHLQLLLRARVRGAPTYFRDWAAALTVGTEQITGYPLFGNEPNETFGHVISWTYGSQSAAGETPGVIAFSFPIPVQNYYRALRETQMPVSVTVTAVDDSDDICSGTFDLRALWEIRHEELPDLPRPNRTARRAPDRKKKPR